MLVGGVRGVVDMCEHVYTCLTIVGDCVELCWMCKVCLIKLGVVWTCLECCELCVMFEEC